MITVRLPKYEERLKMLATSTGRSKAFYIKHLFDLHFEKMERRYKRIDSIDQITNKETLKAIADTEKGKNLKKFKSAKELIQSLKDA
jgi:predicted DNA-binding protein